MTTPNAWDSLPAIIERSGGFLPMNVLALRKFDGAGAAKVNVVARIEHELATRKIGHLPSVIPRDQNAQVLLYNQDKPNMGMVLHLAHQLAQGRSDSGQNPSELVFMLDMALKMYGPATHTAAAEG
jgi:hypothetical protein